MADQDWKTGGLNRSKYIVRKQCLKCQGVGTYCGCGARGLADCACIIGEECDECQGQGHVPTSTDARYFVLRIDGSCDPHARKALGVYANSVESENPEFAADIRDWLADV